jgi:hypothetical protein
MDMPDRHQHQLAQRRARRRELRAGLGARRGDVGRRVRLDSLAARALRPTNRPFVALVVADVGQAHGLVRDGIERIGGSSSLVYHPQEALAVLEASALGITALLVPAADPWFETAVFLEHIADTLPSVRRVAYATRAAENMRALADGHVHATTTAPFSDQELADALWSRRAGVLHATQPSAPSDQQLFDVWRSEPARDFADLDHRYRPRLTLLASSVGFSAADADDLVQETLLNVFIDRDPGSRSPGSDRVVGSVVVSAMMTLLRSDERRVLMLRAAEELTSARSDQGR